MNLKALLEKLNDNASKMEAIVDLIQEGKATDEDRATFDALEAESKQLREDIARIKNVANANLSTPQEPTLSPEDKDAKLFANYIRATVMGMPIAEDANITKGDNGAILPKTIANKIIDRVKEISPLFNDAEKFNVKGTLAIPYVGADDDGIEMAYATEFTDLEAKAAKLSSIELQGHLAGVLTKISKSLINNSDVNITAFVIEKMASAVANFFEHEALVGSSTVTGLAGTTNVVNASSATAITADELIELQAAVKSPYQTGAYFIMNTKTLTALRKLKNEDGEYLLNKDLTTEFGYRLLGHEVKVSDNAPEIATKAKAIYYVNPAQALAVQMVENYQLQVLKEKFATQHAVGLVGWTEFDAKVQNQQAVAVLKMA